VGGLLTHGPLSLPRFFGWRLAIYRRGCVDEDPAALFDSLAKAIKDPNIEIVPEDAKAEAVASGIKSQQ